MKKLSAFVFAMLFLCPNIAYADLIAHYAFDGNANDESGYGNHGTVYGATLTEDRFGNPNSAYEFTDNYGPYVGGDFIEIPDMIEGFQNLSISMWVNEYEIGYVHGESYIAFGDDHNYMVAIHHNKGVNTNKMDFRIANTNQNEVMVDTPFNDAWRNNFIHYALVYDGENGILQGYINGSLIAQTSTSPDPVTTFGDSYAALGKHWWNDGSECSTRFNGVFDDVFIYNSALSESEIQELYNAPNPVPEPTTIFLLGSGLIGLIGFRRKFRENK
jgi:Concanavalin A-like lectin/glucanases superfamily/PEP-CTERM motif